jgi:hypothetical protein
VNERLSRTVPGNQRTCRSGVVALVISCAAFGQQVAPQNTERVIQEADKTVFKKKTVVDFNEVAIDGELTKPEGSYTISKKKTSFRTLIKVRDNFHPELQKSADNL